MKRALKEFYKDAFKFEVLLMSAVLFAGVLVGTWLGAR